MPDKSKMSKRKHGSSVKHYREEGILPEALINYLALLGWNPGTEQEIFSIDELIAAFDITKINKSGAVFDREKLLWFNREYIQRMSAEAFTAYAEPVFRESMEKRGVAYQAQVFASLIPLLMQSVSTSSELAEKCGAGEYDYFFTAPDIASDINSAKIPQKGDSKENAARHLGALHEKLSTLDAAMFSTAERLKDEVWEYATIEGRGSVLWPMRFALSGRDTSPDPFQIASVIGKDETLSRIQRAKDALSL
jgi:glutamyl/glutaminyl-tRNA synthetase